MVKFPSISALPVFSFILLMSFFSDAQNETKKWFFGFFHSIDFMTNPATPSGTLSQMIAPTACSSIADASGNLLFYSNGSQIWDNTHNPMANSTGIVGNGVNLYSTIIIKKPGSSNLYYLFSQSASNSVSHGFYFNVIDMSLASGHGSVVTKCQLLDTTAGNGKLTATTHCNGNDVWILIHDYRNNNFKAYLLTPNGISNNPVVSSIGQIGFSANIGQMKFSPNGKKLAYCATNNLEVYDFDKATGVLSNSLSINTNFMLVSGCEFSPDGTKLYACNYQMRFNGGPDEILQYDLCAGTPSNIIASKTTIDTMTAVRFKAMQLAANGKIYVADDTNISVINNPNALGLACNYTYTPFSYNWFNPVYSLPSFNSAYFNPFPNNATYNIYTQTLCQTVSFSCAIANLIPGCAASGNIPTAAIWDFGEPGSGNLNHSTALFPKHIYQSTGTYSVRGIISHDCKIDTVYKTVNITAYNPTVTITGRDTICQKEWLTLTASGANAYLWNTGATTNSINVMPQFQFTYAVIGTNSNNCSAEKVFTANVNICEGINTSSADIPLYIFPNPTTDFVKIKTTHFQAANITLDLTVTDISGRIVMTRNLLLNQNNLIQLSFLNQGIYFFTVYGNQIPIETKRIIYLKE